MRVKLKLSKKVVIIIHCVTALFLFILALFAFDRIGSMPFSDLRSPDANITVRYGNCEPYEMTQRETSDFIFQLRYLRV